MSYRLHQATFAAKPLARVDLEAIAEGFLRKLYLRNLLHPTQLDVPELMDRLEAECQVVFGVQDLDPGEEGYTDPIRREIIVDTNVYRGAVAGNGRDRMTCCHEVGHIPHIDQVQRIIRSGGPHLNRRINVQVKAYCDPEWQAKGVAAALLMPRATFPAIYRGGGVNSAAVFFGVSPSAAAVRAEVLRGLGLL